MLHGVLPVLHPVVGGIGVYLADAVTGVERQLREEGEGDGVAELLLREHPGDDFVGVDIDKAVQLELASVLWTHLPLGHAPQCGL